MCLLCRRLLGLAGRLLGHIGFRCCLGLLGHIGFRCCLGLLGSLISLLDPPDGIGHIPVSTHNTQRQTGQPASSTVFTMAQWVLQ